METVTEQPLTSFTDIFDGTVTNSGLDTSDAGVSLSVLSTVANDDNEDINKVIDFTSVGHVLYVVLLTITTLAGNIGNICVIGAVLSDKRLRKESNMFIVNLAAADLCVTAFVDPFSIAGAIVGPTFFQGQVVLCHIIGSVCLVSCVCSLYSIAAISINRYVLLCHRAKYQNIYTKKNTCLMILGLWLFAFLLDLPNFLDWGDHNYDMKTLSCSYDRTASYSYTVFFISFFVLLPLFSVVFCNINIYIVVIRSKIKVSSHSESSRVPTMYSYIRTTGAGEPSTASGIHSAVVGSSNPVSSMDDKDREPTIQEEKPSQFLTIKDNLIQQQKKKEKKNKGKKLELSSEVKLAKTLFIIFMFFCVCWAPYALMCLIDRFDNLQKEAYLYAILIAHSSSTMNSLIYAITNRGFQNGYKLFLRKVGFKCFSD